MPEASKPQTNDPVTRGITLAILAGLLLAGWFIRRHPGIPQTALIVLGASFAVTTRTPFIVTKPAWAHKRLYGKGKTTMTRLTVAVFGVVLVGWWPLRFNRIAVPENASALGKLGRSLLAVAMWPFSPTNLAAIALAVFMTKTIGREDRPEDQRQRFKLAQHLARGGTATKDDERTITSYADRGLERLREALKTVRPKAGIVEIGFREDGAITFALVDTKRWPEVLTRDMVAGCFREPGNKVHVEDVSDTGQMGRCVVVVGGEKAPTKPWEVAAPEIPDPEQWPALSIPLGWVVDGILWASLAIHWLIAGMTNSGKSNTLNVLIGGAYRQRFSLFLVDPKQTELWPWRDYAALDTMGEPMYGDDGPSIRKVLLEVERIRNQRKLIRREAGLKKWDEELGPRILVVIDEAAEALKLAPDMAPVIESLARLARAEGITLVMADQHPTEKSFPTIIKRNMPNAVLHRVQDGGAVRVALDEQATKNGWDTSQGNIPAGGGAVRLEGLGTVWVQVFEEGPLPPLRGIPRRPISPSQTPTEGPCPAETGGMDRGMGWDGTDGTPSRPKRPSTPEDRLMRALSESFESGERIIQRANQANDGDPIPRTTGYRKLNELAQNGHVEKDERGRYRSAFLAKLDAELGDSGAA